MKVKHSTIGERIKQLRLQKGVTQQELASKTGINDANIRKYESGRQNPKLETIEKIALALDVSPSVLIFGEADPLAYALLNGSDEIVNAVTNGFPNGNQMQQETIDAVKTELERLRKDTITKYDKLNIAGQEKANGYITALAETKEYTTPEKALQETEGNNE